jgi:hypothetical protein
LRPARQHLLCCLLQQLLLEPSLLPCWQHQLHHQLPAAREGSNV